MDEDTAHDITMKSMGNKYTGCTYFFKINVTNVIGGLLLDIHSYNNTCFAVG